MSLYSVPASGELYIDDGETFEYRKGHYLHRAFKLKDGVFASLSADPTAAFLTNAWIEKVSHTRQGNHIYEFMGDR